MRPREALRQFTGRTHEIGDGPLGQIGGQLLANFRAKEAARLSAADERAAMAGRGPMLAVLERKLGELRAQELFQDDTPCVTRWDAFQALKRARSQYATDQGLKRATTHVERWWHQDPRGVLRLGDIAKLRAHYSREFPKSVVAEVIDREIPAVGFNTLPVAKLAALAAQIRGNDDAQRQYAFEQVVRANGLATNKPEHTRARAYLLELADMPAEPQANSHGAQGAVERTLSRMASFGDPILAQLEMPPPGPGGDDAMPPGGGGEMPPMDEGPGEPEPVMLDSPITGEPMELSLQPAAGEGEMLDDGSGEPPAQEIPPGVVASLAYFGQLGDFEAPPSQSGDEGIDGMDPGGESSGTVEDPTAPGEMLEVTVAPLEGGAPEDTGMAMSPAPALGMDNAASRQAVGRHVFAVHEVRGGVINARPIDCQRTIGMPAMLCHVARQMRAAQGGVHQEVRADARLFAQEAFVVLDDECGNYLYVTAVKDEFEPKIVTDGQPTVRHHLELSDDQGREVLMDEKDLKQTPPKALSDEPPKPKKMSRKQARAVCARSGLTAKKIEARLLDGDDVVVGQNRLALNDSGEVEIFRGDRGRAASLLHLDRVIDDFIALAAVDLLSRKKTAFRVRALFSAWCRQCGTDGEYLMPDVPHDIRCASCGWITPVEAISIQLEARADAFPGYVITAEVPGNEKDRRLNAKRMLAAIREVTPTDGAKMREGQLEVAIRGAGEAEINRIRRVLADVFGAYELVAQQMPMTAPQSPTQQHQTQQLAPAQQQQLQPTYQPPPTPPDMPLQQQQMQQPMGTTADPLVPPMRAASLPVGPGIRHARIRYPDGREAWMPVEAATDQMARSIIGSFLDGTTVLEIVDSRVRHAQMAGPPGGAPRPQQPAPPPGGGGTPMAMPPAAEGMGMGGGNEPQNMPEDVDSASIDPKIEEAIRAKILTARTEGLPIDRAVSEVTSGYKALLQQFGDESAPSRHLVGAAVLRIATEIYKQPALVNMARQRRALPVPLASTRQAAEPKGPKPKKINTQQDDWVSLPGGGEVLGSDSSTAKGPKDPKVNQQVDTIAKQPGAKGAPTKIDPDSSVRDPGRFKAPKPKSDGRTLTDGGGRSYTNTNLGEDTQNKENAPTRKWDSVSSGAYRNVRSK